MATEPDVPLFPDDDQHHHDDEDDDDGLSLQQSNWLVSSSA